MAARLDCDLRQPRQAVKVHQIADHENLGVSWQRAVGSHFHASGAVGARAGDHASERRGLDAGGPDLCDRFDPLESWVLRVGVDATLIDAGDHRAEVYFHAGALKRSCGAALQ